MLPPLILLQISNNSQKLHLSFDIVEFITVLYVSLNRNICILLLTLQTNIKNTVSVSLYIEQEHIFSQNTCFMIDLKPFLQGSGLNLINSKPQF